MGARKLLIGALLVFATTVANGAAAHAETRSQLFGFTKQVNTFTVPDGVRQLTVTVAGGHGGWTERTARGGDGSAVTGTVDVTSGAVLDVYVGGYGGNNGAWGFGDGGDTGGSAAFSHSGKGGGGGSALISDDETPLIVAGGGGGGGGDGAGDGYYGGLGGDGGRPAPNGGDARHASGGSGGSGGCDGCRGRNGQNSRGTIEGSSGGGGGGGWAGGSAGEIPSGVEGGGGGGGGGLSYVDASVRSPQYSTNRVAGDRPHGYVRVSWTPDTPAQIAVHADSSGQQAEVGTPFARPLQARVTAQDGDPIAGAAVRFAAPSSGASGTFAGGVAVVTVKADASGVATAPPLKADLGVGVWTVAATVAGVSGQASFSMLNAAAQTTLALAPSTQPSVFGQSIGYSAYVTAAATAGRPQGSISFSVDGRPLGAPVQLVGGVATSASIASLRPGDHKVDATYAPATPTFEPATSTARQTVGPALATVRLRSSENPTEAGHVLFFTADVAAAAPGGGTPDGSVAFSIDGVALETVPLVGGTATTTGGWTPLVAGHRQVLATYLPAGDPGDPADLPRYVTTAASLDQATGPGSTTTGVTSSAEPAVTGQPVRLTATVDGRDVLAPGGTVTFELDGAEICRDVAVALAAGSARAGCDVAPERLTVGEHQVLARYSGDPAQSLQGSSGALTQRVAAAPTAIELRSLPDPTVFGQPLTLSADVAVAEPGAGTPTGTVQFFADGRTIGTPRPLDGDGHAQLGLLAQLTAGPQTISARYSGDGSFLPRDESETHAVERAGTELALVSPAEPSTPGQPLAFRAQLTAVAPGFGNPPGQVQFRLDGEPLGEPVDVAADGTALSPPATGLATGGHQLLASYLGGHDFQPSETAIEQRVAVPVVPPPPSGGGDVAPPPLLPPPADGGSRCEAAPLLTEAWLTNGRVRVSGFDPRARAGARATVQANGRAVARTRVRADGTLSLTAPRPRGAGWRATRYRVVVDGRASQQARLVRRMHLEGRRLALGGTLRVRLRLLSGRRDRVKLTLQRTDGCPASAPVRAGTLRTDRRGRAVVTLRRPSAAQRMAVYRVRTSTGAALALPIVVLAASKERSDDAPPTVA